MTGALAPDRGRSMRPCNKKPGAVSRPGSWRSFGEYAFLEDSRYTSQEGRGTSRGSTRCRRFQCRAGSL